MMLEVNIIKQIERKTFLQEKYRQKFQFCSTNVKRDKPFPDQLTKPLQTTYN